MTILRSLETIIIKGSQIRFWVEVPESQLREIWEKNWPDKAFPGVAGFIFAEEEFDRLCLVLGHLTSDEKKPFPFGKIDDGSLSICGAATFDNKEQKYVVFIRKSCMDRIGKDGLDYVVTHELAHIARGDINQENEV